MIRRAFSPGLSAALALAAGGWILPAIGFAAAAEAASTTGSGNGAAAARPRLVVLAVDGAGRLLVERLLASGELPNFARLRREGAFSDGLIPAHPSRTAPSFAAIWNGLPGAETGVTGNTVLATPPESFSLLETRDGFSAETLRTDPLWVRTARAGIRAVTLHTTHTFPLEPALARLGARDRERLFVLTGYTDLRLPPATLDEENSPLLAAAPAAVGAGFGEGAGFFRFRVGDSRFVGALFDDPALAGSGWDTLGVLPDEARGAGEPTGPAGDAGASPLLLARVRVGGEGEFSIPVAARSGGRRADFRIRAFAARTSSAEAPGRFVVFRSGARAVAAHPEGAWRARLGAPFYSGTIGPAEFASGRLGPRRETPAAGKDAVGGGPGVAVGRLLDIVEALADTAIEHLAAGAEIPDWGLLALYLPFADEMAHLTYGHLDEGLPSYDADRAAAARPLFVGAFREVDRVLGRAFAVAEDAGAHLLVVGDHGMAGSDRRAHLNVALERAGLLAFDEDGLPDLSRTEALLLPTGDGSVAVNRASRPGGVVEGAGEADVLRAAREALLALRTPEGSGVVTGFLEPSAGGAVRFGGDSTGDLFPILAPGLRSSPLPAPEVVMPAPPAGGHGFLSTRLDMLAVFAAWGPRVAPGARPRSSALDVLPTALDLLGIPPDPALPGRSLLSDAPLVAPGAAGSPWKERPALRFSTGRQEVPDRFRCGALFPRAGGANRCAIPPAVYRGEGATPSPHPSPVGASRRRALPGLRPQAARAPGENR